MALPLNDHTRLIYKSDFVWILSTVLLMKWLLSKILSKVLRRLNLNAASVVRFTNSRSRVDVTSNCQLKKKNWNIGPVAGEISVDHKLNLCACKNEILQMWTFSASYTETTLWRCIIPFTPSSTLMFTISQRCGSTAASSVPLLNNVWTNMVY